jgi:tRNA threonylcarbamoyl adenosine modification protein YeaZ
MPSCLDSHQYGFALHTSSPQLGLAISNFGNEHRSQTWDLGRDLSTHLHQYLAEFLAPQTWQDLAFVAVAKGPGGFTGTRIGVVTARTLAQQLDIPLFAISTLAAVAWEYLSPLVSNSLSSRACFQTSPLHLDPPQPPLKRGENIAVAVQMPAQRGQLFTAIYQVSASDGGLNTLFPDTVLTPEQWQQTLGNWQTTYELIDIPAGGGLAASVSSLLELAYIDWQQGKRPHWEEALPFYGQHPVEV